MIKYSFCETLFSVSDTPWHIRRLTDAGRKLGGGTDTRALCGREVSWDLETQLTQHDLEKNCCPRCCVIYKEERLGGG